MSFKERLLIGSFGPRGIVAASVAGIIGLRLELQGFPDASFILPIVFSVVCLTVLIHGLSLNFIADRLNIRIKSGKGLVISGASPWSTALALTLINLEVPVLIVDSTWYKLKGPRQSGIPTHYGEIIVDVEDGRLDLTEYGYLLAATDSNSYNALVCNSLAEDFGRNNTYQLPLDEAKYNSNLDELPRSQGGQTLEGELVFDNLKQKMYYGWEFKHTPLTKEYDYEQFKKSFDQQDSILLMTIHKDKSISFVLDTVKMKPQPGDIVVSFANKSKDDTNEH